MAEAKAYARSVVSEAVPMSAEAEASARKAVGETHAKSAEAEASAHISSFREPRQQKVRRHKPLHTQRWRRQKHMPTRLSAMSAVAKHLLTQSFCEPSQQKSAEAKASAHTVVYEPSAMSAEAKMLVSIYNVREKSDV